METSIKREPKKMGKPRKCGQNAYNPYIHQQNNYIFPPYYNHYNNRPHQQNPHFGGRFYNGGYNNQQRYNNAHPGGGYNNGYRNYHHHNYQPVEHYNVNQFPQNNNGLKYFEDEYAQPRKRCCTNKHPHHFHIPNWVQPPAHIDQFNGHLSPKRNSAQNCAQTPLNPSPIAKQTNHSDQNMYDKENVNKINDLNELPATIEDLQKSIENRDAMFKNQLNNTPIIANTANHSVLNEKTIIDAVSNKQVKAEPTTNDTSNQTPVISKEQFKTEPITHDTSNVFALNQVPVSEEQLNNKPVINCNSNNSILNEVAIIDTISNKQLNPEPINVTSAVLVLNEMAVIDAVPNKQLNTETIIEGRSNHTVFNEVPVNDALQIGAINNGTSDRSTLNELAIIDAKQLNTGLINHSVLKEMPTIGAQLNTGPRSNNSVKNEVSMIVDQELLPNQTHGKLAEMANLNDTPKIRVVSNHILFPNYNPPISKTFPNETTKLNNHTLVGSHGGEQLCSTIVEESQINQTVQKLPKLIKIDIKSNQMASNVVWNTKQSKENPEEKDKAVSVEKPSELTAEKTKKKKRRKSRANSEELRKEEYPDWEVVGKSETGIRIRKKAEKCVYISDDSDAESDEASSKKIKLSEIEDPAELELFEEYMWKLAARNNAILRAHGIIKPECTSQDKRETEETMVSEIIESDEDVDSILGAEDFITLNEEPEEIENVQKVQDSGAEQSKIVKDSFEQSKIDQNSVERNKILHDNSEDEAICVDHSENECNNNIALITSESKIAKECTLADFSHIQITDVRTLKLENGNGVFTSSKLEQFLGDMC